MSISKFRIAIVAGEASGDLIGASLIHALKKHYPDAEFVGVAGPHMQAAGCRSLYPLETLSVMGFIAPLLRMRSLWQCFHGLLADFIQTPVDVFIGIDSPDFNLRLAKKLKAKGIKTVHWVSPSVWAWRSGRIHSIKKSIDLMMVLFPFESKIYEENQIPVVYTGHPLAHEIPLEITDSMRAGAGCQLGLNPELPVCGLLPGSRKAELHYLAKTFLETAELLKARYPTMQFIIPAANSHRYQELLLLIKDFPQLSIHLVEGKAREVLMASQVALVASGTITLEAMLCKTPMVVAYKMSALTYQIAKRVINVPYISLPNLLLNKGVVPECIQSQVTRSHLYDLLQQWMPDHSEGVLRRANLIDAFTNIHTVLKQDAAAIAARAIKNSLKN